MSLGLGAEELLARLFDDFFYGVTIVNADSEIVYYNGTQAAIDGVLPSDALGRQLDEVHRPNGRPAPTLAASLSRTPAMNQPFLYKTASGRLVNSVQNAFPITKDGVLLGCVTFIGEYGRIMDAYAEAAGARSIASAEGGNGNGNGNGGGSGTLVIVDSARAHAMTSDAPLTSDGVFQAVIEAAHRAAGSPSPMLFTGERGTGKDLLARTVAAASGRGGPFLSLKFGTVPESLLEGILFGTEEGAYTGAADRPGILELASGGTVYLDEISAIPHGIQERLSAAAEDGRAPRVGAAGGARELDVKFMSASSMPLQEAVSTGLVKPGLLVRLGVVTLSIPPMRERPGDVPLLADHFVKAYSSAFSKSAEGVTDEVREAFLRHAWPGNVRELKSGIEGAMNAVDMEETLLNPLHFSSTLLERLFREQDGASSFRDGSRDGAQRPAHYLHSAAEAERIAAALEAAGGNAAKAARSLKISPQLMNYKLKKFALKKKITVQVG
ncbi:MAG: sigma 54-interacting transcriptional regulator [Deltaproteobacteria bacterium]|jgi:arginine utilization regulatory protein|nr:sigma 54-interacting transcriptional regulator [Deltaproteobacteria bacterium]